MTRYLQRPRRVGFGEAVDFSNLDTSAFDFNAAGDFTAAPPPANDGFDFSKLAADVVKGAQTYYGAQTAVAQAQGAQALAKARQDAALQLVRAQGGNAAQTAKAGLPSATLLLAAGVGLAALFIWKR